MRGRGRGLSTLLRGRCFSSCMGHIKSVRKIDGVFACTAMPISFSASGSVSSDALVLNCGRGSLTSLGTTILSKGVASSARLIMDSPRHVCSICR